jgi:hypothetical protein
MRPPPPLTDLYGWLAIMIAVRFGIYVDRQTAKRAAFAEAYGFDPWKILTTKAELENQS